LRGDGVAVGAKILTLERLMAAAVSRLLSVGLILAPPVVVKDVV